ncbi:MAG: magnesium/cobalt transporter CorA [Aeromicrobium sp.]
MIIDCAIYRDGKREDTSHDVKSLQNALDSLEGKHDFIWIGLFEPSASELAEIGAPLRLHPLAIEDAVEAHQRPKVERYDDHLFMSIKTVTYDNDDIETAEVNAFLGANYLLTVRHGKGHDLRAVRHRAETQDHELEHGPTAALYAVVDSVVDDYEHVAAELEIDVQEVETSVFSNIRTSDSSRIYRLKREALEFRRAVMPLREPVNRFSAGAMPEEARPYFRDIGDHLSRVAESIDATDHLLDNALNAHLAHLAIQQNDDMRKLAAGATLFGVPTAIAGVYGMNFDHMPELRWQYGYPMVVVAMVALCALIVWRFRKSGWL